MKRILSNLAFLLPVCLGATVDWASINAKLPAKTDDVSKKARTEMFSRFDVNGNGILSLAETTKGIQEVVNIPELSAGIPAINRAFHTAKIVANKTGQGADYIERNEFRVFLETLRNDFEYLQAFERLDTNTDDKLTKDEFVAPAAVDQLKKWVNGFADVEKEFTDMDKNGGGQILFDEFVNWAFKRQLDIEDDIEP